FTCRRCRYAKCVAVGMDSACVPTARNFRMPVKTIKKSSSKPASKLPVAEAKQTPTVLLDMIAKEYKSLETTAMRNDEKVMIEAS
ncbi:hypothetical protein PMAYCL1PPCAC_09962, partial [Pristionchus mayeri]